MQTGLNVLKTFILTYIKVADPSIDSCIKCPIEFHCERVSVVSLSPITINKWLQLVYIVFNQFGTILYRVEYSLNSGRGRKREKERERKTHKINDQFKQCGCALLISILVHMHSTCQVCDAQVVKQKELNNKLIPISLCICTCIN